MPQRKLQMSEAKLRKVIADVERLKTLLEIQRVPVSEASNSLIDYCKVTKDPLLPSVWGPIEKKDDPFAPANSGSGCCVVM